MFSKAPLLLFAAAAALSGADTLALFADLFPSDSLTVPDGKQKTGRRISLPIAAAGFQEINTLDGFNPNPRIRVRFSAPVNTNTLREGIRLIALDNLTDEEYGLHRLGEAIPINRVVYDPATNAVFAKPDSVLDQHRRYAILVTSAVRDRDGAAVQPDPLFRACLDRQDPYCAAVRQAVAAGRAEAGQHPIVAASVFTTLSATAWLESARNRLERIPPSPAPLGQTGSFDFPELSTVTLRQQTGIQPLRFEEQTLPVSLLGIIPTGVTNPIGKIAFGTFQSPRFLGPHFQIEPIPTLAEPDLPFSVDTLAFHALVPSRPRPEAGYPVVVFGHGFTDSRFGGPSAVAPVLNAAGFAVAALNAFGHGYGPASTVILTRRNGSATEIPAPGRGVDFDGDGRIGDQEGCLILTLEQPLALRDCLRQTAVDLMQFTRAIRAGMDLDRDGRADFDPNRVYYAGMSLGGLYGAIFGAVDREVQSLALNVAGGSVVEIARQSDSYRKETIRYLAQLGLLNSPGEFADDLPGRHEPVRIVRTPGALEIQDTLERFEWLQASGDPLFYAPHLRSSTLPAVPMKSVLWQAAKGDRTVPLTAQAGLIRAANMRESTWLFRNDWARDASPSLPENPHAFLANLFSLPAIPIAVAAQRQMAEFFATGTIADPNAVVRPTFRRDLFEVPGAFSEELNY